MQRGRHCIVSRQEAGQAAWEGVEEVPWHSGNAMCVPVRATSA